MARFIMFLAALFKEVQKDDLISAANDLTYKMLAALFPFIIFLLSIVSYLEMDAYELLGNLERALPNGVMGVISPFFEEVLLVKRPSILSISLGLMLWSASAGFISVMKGINKAYGRKDERNFFVRRFTSISLVFVFAVSILMSMIMLIFNENIHALAVRYFPGLKAAGYLFSALGYIITVCVLLLSVLYINKISLSGKQSIKSLLPGSVFTVVCWVVLSKAFNIYVNNFSSYSAVYGSVAGILILMVWLNLMCSVLLTGSEISAMLEHRENKEYKKEEKRDGQ